MHNRIKQQVEENYVLWNAINRIYGNWAKKNGMTYHSLFTLYTIHTNQQDCCQSTICDETSTPKQTVNSILKEFEKKNYIYYEKDEKDKRNKMIKLTAEGQVFASSILDPLFQLETTVMEKMGKEQSTQKNTLAYILIYGEPLILFFLVSFVLPPAVPVKWTLDVSSRYTVLVAAAGFIFIRISPLHAVPKTVKKNRPQTENQMGL